MIALWKQAVMAVTTELASLSMLDGSSSSLVLLAYFTLHAVASGLTTSLAYFFLPEQWRTPRAGVLALLYGFAFFIPGLGIIATVLVIQVAMRFPRAISTERYTPIEETRYSPTEKESAEMPDLRVGYARRILRDPAQSVDNKLRVLIALQGMRPKVAIPLLQGLLGDPAEDVRLLAYSMMDAWEKDLTVQLQKAQGQLDELGHDEEARTQRMNANRRLAELYWEQVDSGLARGDLRQFALLKAKKHAEAALALDANTASIWMLYSRVLTELGMADLARRTLRLARKAGLPGAQVTPLLAQLAFEEGRYDQVRDYVAHLDGQEQLPHAVRQVVAYWSGKSLDVRL